MVFVSLPFLLVFFPLCMAFYAFSKSIKTKNTVLLVFSLIFYAWGEPKYILLLLFMSFADWFFALMIEACKARSKKKLFLIAACVVNLGLIGIFKYGTFAIDNFNNLFGIDKAVPDIALPIGISFYTFQLLSYVVDVYRGDVKAQKDYKIVLLYASLFHQCIAGPIVRYKDVEAQLLSRQPNLTNISRGINRFCIGLAKKAVFANTCGKLFETLVVSDTLVNTPEAVEIVASKPAGALWLGMLLFALQIYLDFSAYSDMAIGMGKLIGLDYKENFDYPYLSRSVTEFWRRWHISLGSFFRDYVYIPLGGNRRGELRTYLNLFITWALTGFWHGASWNYVLWGLYFFVFLALEKKVLKNYLSRNKYLANIYLLIVAFFGWVLFKFENMQVMGTVLKGMFGLNGNGFTSFEVSATFTGNIIFIIIACIACTPLLKKISEILKKNAATNKIAEIIWSVGTVVSPTVLIIISLLNIVGNSYNPFLYFQF